MYKQGETIKYKTQHGQTVTGEVFDCNEFAIIVLNPVFGQQIIDHSSVIKEAKITPMTEEEEHLYYAEYTGNTGYSIKKSYNSPYGYLSPETDDFGDDGC